MAKDQGIAIPDDRIWLTRDDTNTKHQSRSRKISWSTAIDLFMSDDYFKTTPVMALEQGNTIIKTPQYMFVSCSAADQVRVTIYSSTFRSGFKNLKKVRVPRDAVATTTFTLMDTSEDQVFLFLENHGLTTPFGNLYISDENARAFSLSMENVIKGNAVDFERVTSLDGTFIINKYMDEGNRASKKTVRERSNKDEPDFVEEFSEADIISNENRKSKMSRGSTDTTSWK